jgi:hypothetical protein
MPVKVDPDSKLVLVDADTKKVLCCDNCPRDITDLSSVTVDTTIDVSNSTEGCILDYSQTDSKTWTRINRFNPDGSFAGEPGDYEFQIIWYQAEGDPPCGTFAFFVGGPGWPTGHGGVFDGATCIIALNTFPGDCDTASLFAVGSAYLSQSAGVLYVSAFGSFAMACGTPDPSACPKSENVGTDPFLPGSSTPAGLIGSYTLDETGGSGDYSWHIVTVVTIA